MAVARAKEYVIGKRVRVIGAFTDENGDPIDPSAVFVATLNPKGNEVVYQFGVDVEVVKDSVGNYHLVVTPTVPGKWYYRWYSTGIAKTADEDVFIVLPTCFTQA